MMIVNILKEVIPIFMLTLLRKKKFTLLNSSDKQYLQLFCGKCLFKNYLFFFLFSFATTTTKPNVTCPISPSNEVMGPSLLIEMARVLPMSLKLMPRLLTI